MHRPPGQERHSVGPSAIPPAASAPTAAPDSTRDVAQEDFLFHLYRGSELLQENRVLEAKEELEFALTMQPLDAKGQDLLAAVYFRLGLYPRAIQIYESLVGQFPRDTSVKVNLALACLKTGQPEPARQALRDVVGLNPEHKRAWGYLGLALQKLGEFEQAQLAFERGGHAMMAKRMTERRRSLFPGASAAPPEIERRVREAAEMAFSELDAGELRFALAEPEAPRPGEGQWHTVEPGEAAPPPVRPSATPEPSIAHRTAQEGPPDAAAPTAGPVARTATGAPSVSAWTRIVPPAPPTLSPLLDGPGEASPPLPSLLALLGDRSLALHGPQVALAQTHDDPQGAFACRLDALRVVAGAASTRILHRRNREADTPEVLGGVGSPLVRVWGTTQLVLGARPGHELALFAIDQGLAFVREDLLLGFELRLGYENGRVMLESADGSAGDGSRPAGDATPVIQMRGTGAFVLELVGKLASLPAAPGHPLLVRREWIVGWLGRLMARALPPAESPSGQRGLVSFSGEGTVLACTG
ncbi:MAG TPA: tetratricopeptide repeat protein [Polyangiaceae bacterium]|nr:tetratricopeptide repeat protein [Polyangiaceae bacterium]